MSCGLALDSIAEVRAGSWQTFSDSCCCMNRTTTFAGSLVPTELWVCDGASRNSSTTLYKERPRGNSSGTLYHVRPFCEASLAHLRSVSVHLR